MRGTHMCPEGEQMTYAGEKGLRGQEMPEHQLRAGHCARPSVSEISLIFIMKLMLVSPPPFTVKDTDGSERLRNLPEGFEPIQGCQTTKTKPQTNKKETCPRAPDC